MGIDRVAAKLLFQVAKKIDITGYTLTLGKQDVLIDHRVFAGLLKRYRVETQIPKLVDDQVLFGALGSSKLLSLDISSYESADLIHDLNLAVPENLHSNFNLIYNGGTLEHIFNLSAVLENIFMMLKIGGVVIHASPSHNYIDHGFYSLSPTFFWDWYVSNNWEIVDCFLVECRRDPNVKNNIYKYLSGSVDHLSFGGWGKGMVYTFFVARKTENSTCDVVPQQGSYKKIGMVSHCHLGGLEQKIRSRC